MGQKPMIGFIGLGVMGRSMARNMMNAGFPLTVFTRSKEKADDLLRDGALWADTPAALSATCEFVITIVGYPDDVEEVYFAEHGIFAGVEHGTMLIDMTTSSPELSQRIYNKAKELGCQALDAPVSGGDIGARNGKLSIMVGGDHNTFDEALPLFQILGENIVYQGTAGSGQHCKMCNQIAIASTMVGVCEAIAYAQEAGLEPETVLQSISTGAAGSWSLTNLAPRILDSDYNPGFYVKHFIKDMEIAAVESRSMPLETPGLDLALRMYHELAASGFGDEGTQSLFRRYDQRQ